MVEIKEGDVVQLKSGGPRMTVKEYSSASGECVCAWFEGANVRNGSFKPSLLRLAPEDGQTSR